MSFVHLHNHTHYSLLDGLSRPAECVEIAKKDGAPAVAMTDHGVLYGAIEFYKSAKEQDIKPIIGCEMYIAPAGRLRKEPGLPINHLTVLAANNQGYENLLALVSKAHLEGFYYKPRIDHGLLREYSKGLIVLSGCIASEVAEATLSEDEAKAIETIKLYQEIVGKENFFLEVMDHPEMQEQIFIRQKYQDYAKRFDMPVVATNDNHYAQKEDAAAHDVLLCIQTNRTVDQENRMKLDGDYYMRSPENMAEAFKDFPEAIKNTVEIANRCEVEIKFKQNLIPNYDTKDGRSYEEELRELCEIGLKERYGDNPSKEVKDRLEYELKIIEASGFPVYFLIVHDLIKFAKESGVIVGPGRGSAAGSIASYCLKITDLDPLKYGLLFERFLNPERVSMPDIDIDFDDERRGEVLQYVVEKYGKDHVAHIITFGTMAARAAVRDVGRALGVPYADVDRVAKIIPPPIQGRHIPLADSVENDPELKKVYIGDPVTTELLDFAIKLEGTVRHAGTHACAVVFSSQPLSKVTPLQHAAGKDSEAVTTQYSMHPIEELGLLKLDFLGLRNLSIINRTLDIIERRHKERLDIANLTLDDEKAYALLAAGNTAGVFQMESSGMRHYLKELQPSEFNDIIAMVSLYRPGPMAWIPTYINGKHAPNKVKYMHKVFEPILKETYGVAIYQEQILQIARDFSGFSLGEADILRKAVGKKNAELLNEQRAKFVKGAVLEGHKEKFAEKVFKDVIEPFAAYGFNKSHAACYALIAYQTAYLKANYPVEFMAALMTSDADNMDRIALEVQECADMGITVLPPSVNESFANFTVVDQSTIRFGLKAIKGLGETVIEGVIDARGEENMPFKDIDDFSKRVRNEVLNKKSIEAMAYSGAMDDLGESNAIAASTDRIVDHSRQIQRISDEGQTDIFGMMTGDDFEPPPPLELAKAPEATKFEKLSYEKEYLGLYVSGHPLQGLDYYFAKKTRPLARLGSLDEKAKHKVGGLVTKVKKIMTKNGSYMAYISVEDMTGRSEIILFPKFYQVFADKLEEGMVAFFEGRVSKRREEPQFMADSVKRVSLDILVKNAKEAGVYGKKPEYDFHDEPYVIKLTSSTSPEVFGKLKAFLKERRGDRRVVLEIRGEDKIKKVNVPFGVNVTDDFETHIASFL
jgi:DNA polymerase III subunit alpha